MKTTITLICFLASGLMLQAQSKDEQAVAASLDAFNQAMLEGNRSMLDFFTLDALSYGHSSGRLENKAQFVEALGSGSSDVKTLDVSNQSITISGKTALVRNEIQIAGVDGGSEFDVKLGVLMVWQKEKGKWKLLGRQAFKL